jgi:hypothetical protein
VDEVARIARTTPMSPLARQELCKELEKTYAFINNKKLGAEFLYD